MKNIILFLVCLVFQKTAIAADEIKLCYEDTVVFPWITGDETGLVFTELNHIEKKLNIKFKYIRMPWKRCQFEALSGNMDGLIAASFTKERTAWGVYPTDSSGNIDGELRLHTDSFYVFVRKDSVITFKNGKFENLKNNPIGVQLGYSVGSDLKDQGYAIHSAFSTAADLLNELEFQSLQVAVLQNHESTRIINANPKYKKNIRRLVPPFKIANQFLLFTKLFFQKNEKLAKTIWQAMPEARNNTNYKKQEQILLKTL